jgi:ubiquinone/menaquinone biosynthesis C-methylase UbiE
VQGFAERLPFKDHSFDLVPCCDILEHEADRQTVLGEISRGLRPGGSSFTGPSTGPS